LESGEAFFEVAKHAEWPFVVTAGDRDVTALGTAFLVRRDRARIAVTLVEGQVAVSRVGEELFAGSSTAVRGDSGVMPSRTGDGRTHRGDTKTPAALTAHLTLVPGQRVIFVDHGAPVLDRPQIEKLTAWQQGLVNIDDLTLAQAVEEMNRYGAVQLAVEGPAAELRVSGVFRVTDSENLAQAVAQTHRLDMRREGRRIVLSGVPQAPSESRFDDISPQADGRH